LTDDIRAFQQYGYGRGLNGGRFLETHPLDRLQDLRLQAKFGEELLLHSALEHGKRKKLRTIGVLSGDF
jgi:hypothetical protein